MRRHTFSRKTALVDREGGSSQRNYPRVCWNPPPGAQRDHVPWDQSCCIQRAHPRAIPQHARSRRLQSLERPQGPLGSPRVRDADRRVNDQHTEDDCRLGVRVDIPLDGRQQSGECRDAQQRLHESVAELLQDQRP